MKCFIGCLALYFSFRRNYPFTCCAQKKEKKKKYQEGISTFYDGPLLTPDLRETGEAFHFGQRSLYINNMNLRKSISSETDVDVIDDTRIVYIA